MSEGAQVEEEDGEFGKEDGGCEPEHAKPVCLGI